MCLLVAKKANGIVNRDEMLTASQNNPNGMGVVYAKNGVLKSYRTMSDFNKFWATIEKNMDCPMVIHFRFATHGETSTYNVHPFKVNDNLYMAHNGVIYLKSHTTTDKRSDTHFYVNEVLQKLPADFIYNPTTVALVEHHIGASNKFAFVDNLGALFILNEKAGSWTGETWYSNQSHKAGRIDRGGVSLSSGYFYGDDYYGRSKSYTPKSYESTNSQVKKTSDYSKWWEAQDELGYLSSVDVNKEDKRYYNADGSLVKVYDGWSNKIIPLIEYEEDYGLQYREADFGKEMTEAIKQAVIEANKPSNQCQVGC